MNWKDAVSDSSNVGEVYYRAFQLRQHQNCKQFAGFGNDFLAKQLEIRFRVFMECVREVFSNGIERDQFLQPSD